MNSVIVRMSGGLGNQLFQYAAGRSLALRLGTSLQLDVSQYTSGKDKRQFELDPFKHHFTHLDERDADAWRKQASRLHNLHRPTRKHAGLNNFMHGRFPDVFLEKDFRFQHAWTALKSPKYLFGNWMSERYFAPHVDLMRRDFAALLNAPQNEIAVHIRLTDYLTGTNPKKFKGSCDVSYYAQAMAVFRNLVPNARFLVFSDDIAAARALIPNDGSVRFDEAGVEPPLQTLLRMAACRHTIIANSTFSWWAAWLNQNPQKMVIAPRHWFSRSYGRKHDLNDILPPSWITLDNDTYSEDLS
jgi:hypothetical protein